MNDRDPKNGEGLRVDPRGKLGTRSELDELLELPEGWWVSVTMLFTSGAVFGAAIVGIVWWLS